MFSDLTLATRIIALLQQHIHLLGFTPLIHFELEGCCRFSSHKKNHTIDFDLINLKLKQHRIEGHLVPEYWQHQWEYVSDFSGQSPLKEAHNLAFVIEHLPRWFKAQGVEKTLIEPVIWSGDQGKLANGSKNIFMPEARAVHIPNAIQVNISALNQQGENIIPSHYFGEYLQQCFLDTSLDCCLLYMPEPDAFERLTLKSKYGLAEELCSPTDISGGHKGSIALYKEFGKHDQPMGVEPLLVDQYQQTIAVKQDWQKTARVEHRLRASSTAYNPYVNVIFCLANLIDALDMYVKGKCQQQMRAEPIGKVLPHQLMGDPHGFDALSLFESSDWLSARIDSSVAEVHGQQVANNMGNNHSGYLEQPENSTSLGKQLKQQIIDSVSLNQIKSL